MKYSIPLGTSHIELEVVLHLAETYDQITQSEKRVFDIKMEGSIVFSDVDPFALAGNAIMAAATLTTTVTVSDGELTIEFVKGRQNPKVSLASSSGTDRTVALDGSHGRSCFIALRY
jgi:hypothetical protein